MVSAVCGVLMNLAADAAFQPNLKQVGLRACRQLNSRGAGGGARQGGERAGAMGAGGEGGEQRRARGCVVVAHAQPAQRVHYSNGARHFAAG